MNQVISDVANLEKYSLGNVDFRAQCKRTLDENGVLAMPNFLKSSAVESIRIEGELSQHLAYYTVDGHNIYLKENDPDFPPDHARNRQVSSSKGCITMDQIPTNSALHTLYNSSEFREFLCAGHGKVSDLSLIRIFNRLSTISLA